MPFHSQFYPHKPPKQPSFPMFWKITIAKNIQLSETFIMHTSKDLDYKICLSLCTNYNTFIKHPLTSQSVPGAHIAVQNKGPTCIQSLTIRSAILRGETLPLLSPPGQHRIRRRGEVHGAR